MRTHNKVHSQELLRNNLWTYNIILVLFKLDLNPFKFNTVLFSLFNTFKMIFVKYN